MSLYPTRTRLALLQAVADGDVVRDHLAAPGGIDVWMGARVTARVTELKTAGWVRLGSALRSRSGVPLPQIWEITPAGRMILEGGGLILDVRRVGK